MSGRCLFRPWIVAVVIVAGSNAVMAVLLPVTVDLATRIATGTIAIPITVIARSGSVLAIALSVAARIAIAAAAWGNCLRWGI